MIDDHEITESIEWIRHDIEFLQRDAARVSEAIDALGKAVEKLERKLARGELGERHAEAIKGHRSYYFMIASHEIDRAVAAVADYARAIRHV